MTKFLQTWNDFDIERVKRILPNGVDLYDAKKILAEGFAVNIVFSERGKKGKTTTFKRLAMNHYLETGEASLWIRNIDKDLDREKETFVESMLQFEENGWNDLQFEGSVAKSNLKLVNNNSKWPNKTVFRFITVNSGPNLKGGRSLAFKYLIWEEFNVNFAGKVREPVQKIMSIIHSAENVVKNWGKESRTRFIMLANMETVNHLVLMHFGITAIKGDSMQSYYKKNGFKFILLLIERIQGAKRALIENKMASNWEFIMSEAMGTAEHAYFNESLYDDINGICQYFDDDQNVLPDFLAIHLTIYIKRENAYINLYRNNNTNFGIHAIHVTEKSATKNIYALKKRDITAFTKFGDMLANSLIERIVHNHLTFENIYTREILITDLVS